MRSIGFLTIALATAVSIGCNKANASRGDSAVGTTGQSNVSRPDTAFVHDLAIFNMAEIELAKLVPERSTDTEIKKFAQLMIDDHTKALDSLKAIAAQYNVPVPSELDGRHTRLRDKIAKWHGNEFDRAYTDAMEDEHDDILDHLEPRVDEARLAEYKAELADRLTGTKAVEQRELVAILPDKSDNTLTMSLNEWAAAAYTLDRAHIEAAKVLKIAADKRRSTN
jgi:putative membrane protein